MPAEDAFAAAVANSNKPLVLQRARAYVATMPPAIEGQNGSGACFRAACVLCVRFRPFVGGSVPLLLEYSDRCVPPWSEKQLQHKLADAAKKAAENPDKVGLLAREQEKKEEEKAEREKKDSTKEQLLAIVAELDLFHTSDRQAYARVLVETEHGEHHEILAIESNAFLYWLSYAYWRQTFGGVASKYLLEEAQWHAASLAHNAGRQEEVFVRIAFFGGAVWFNLGDPEGRAVRITAEGWDVVADCPVAFCRPEGSGALPTPVRGGSISELRAFVNVASDADFRLLVSWLVMCFSPRGDYPVLALSGRHGSAKSTTMQTLLGLIDPPDDPEKDEACGPPASEDDLYVQCKTVRVVAFDNVDFLHLWLAAALCRIATGGSRRKRKLYSDLGQVLVRVWLPIVFNGIPDVLAKRADLLDRAVLLRLPALSGEQRQQYRMRRREWAAAQPRLLGVLLDGVVSALRHKDELEAGMETSPRMGDFLLWAAAAAPAFDGSRFPTQIFKVPIYRRPPRPRGARRQGASRQDASRRLSQ